MKFLKKTQINFRNVSDNSIAVQIDNEITLDSPNVLLIPKGTTTQRPLNTKNGHMRYNTDINEFEFFQNDEWRKVSYKEPTQIVQQDLGIGNGSEIYYGPLDSGNSDYPFPELTSPQNIMVYIDNVFQLANVNYTLEDNPSGYTLGRYIKFTEEVPNTLSVTVLHGFDR
jgi:hypothetical protein